MKQRHLHDQEAAISDSAAGHVVPKTDSASALLKPEMVGR